MLKAISPRIRALALAVVSPILFVAPASAGTVIGSTVQVRQYIDSSPGQVYVYGGGHFDAGLKISTVTWYAGSNGPLLTPILLEETSTHVYTVRGVGTARTSVAGSQSAAFGLQYGSDVTTSGNYTWGFTNAIVSNPGGVQSSTTTGAVWFTDFTSGVDAWYFTPSSFSGNIAVGRTFTLGSDLYASEFRAYSATLSGTAIMKAAPASIMFNAAAGLGTTRSAPVSVCSGTSGSTFTASSNQAWLSASPSSASTGTRSTINLSTATASLNPGVYNGKVTYSASGFTSPATSVMLQLAGPSGTLTQVSANSLGAQWIAVGDFNGDGAIDFATTNYFSNTVSIHLNKGNNGQGVFQGFNITTISSGNFAAPTGITVADFNADGNPDIAVANNGAASLAIMLGKGDGTFQTPTSISTGSNLYQSTVVAGDFDGDCIPDLVVSVYGSPGSAQLWKGDGKGGFSLETTVSLGVGGVNLVAGDFNGDGKLDFAAHDTGNDSAGNSYAWIVLGNGSGGFTKTSIALIGTGFAIAAGDLNGDGITDVAVLTSQEVATLLGHLTTGPTSVTATYPVNTTLGVDHGIGIGDLNGDGKPDFMISAVTNVTTAVMGDGAGGFGKATLITNETDTGFAVADVNGDGLPDLIAANFYYNGNSLLASETEVLLGSVPATSTSLSTTAGSTVVYGSSVPLSISVSGGAGFNALSGSVTIYDGVTSLGAATPGGTAGSYTFSTASLALGAHTLTAVYGSDSFNKTSTSSAVSITVTAVTETLTLSPITTSATYGQSVTFTATLSTAPVGGGSVSFYDGATLLGTGALSGAAATYSTSALTGGTHSITASYAGATGYSAATSGAQIQWVGPAAATVTLGSLTPYVTGSPLPATASTTPASLANTIYYSGTATTLQGSTVSAQWSYPNTGTLYGNQAYVNGSSTPSTATGTVGANGLQFNALAIDASNQTFKLNVFDNLISVSDIRGTYNLGPFSNVTFNGVVITTTANLSSVTLAYSNWINFTAGGAAFNSSNVTFDAHHIYLNFANMQTIAGQQVILAINSGTTAPSAVGTYGVASVVAGPNYTGYATGSLVIAPPPVTVTLTSSSLSQTYTGSPLSAVATTAPSGLDVTYTYNGSSTAPTNAGSYTVVASATNSGVTGTATGTLVISPKPVTLTLNGLAQTYDGTGRSVTATASSGTPSYSVTYAGSAAAPVNAGSYTIVATVTDPNYSGSQTGTLVVSPKSVTYAFSGLAQTYDGTARVVTATPSDAGATPVVKYNGSTTPPVNAGSYPVTATPVSSNYSASGTGTLVVSQVAATVTITNLAQTYTGSALPVSVTTSPAGLSYSLTYNGSTTVPTSAGSYTVVATITDSNGTGSSTRTFVIAQATASVTISGLAQTYSGTARTVTASASPFSGLTFNVTYSSGSAPTNVGSYTVTATIATNPNVAGTATGTLVVSPVAETITLSNLNNTYTGGAWVPFAATSPVGMPVTFTYNGSSTAPSNAGTYTVVATINSPNGTGTATATMTIAKNVQPVLFSRLTDQTYTGSPVSVLAYVNYSGPTRSLGTGQRLLRQRVLAYVNYSGPTLANPLAVTVLYNGSATPPTNVGSYPVTAAINDPNYTGSASATFVINKATASVNLSGLPNVTFDGSPHSLTPSAYSYATNSVLATTLTTTYNGSTTAPTNAGTYHVVATVVDPNYQGTNAYDLVINQAPATVVFSGSTS